MRNMGHADFRIDTPLSVQECLTTLREAGVGSLPHANEKIAPLRIRTKWGDILLSWWLTPSWAEANELKTWSGHVKPLSIVEDLLGFLNAVPENIESDLFAWRKGMKRRFGLDALASWNPRNIGFSPFVAGIQVATSVLVELLGAIGLQTFGLSRTEGGFEYSLWGWSLPGRVAKVVWSGAAGMGAIARFRTGLVERGTYKGLSRGRLVGF